MIGLLAFAGEQTAKINSPLSCGAVAAKARLQAARSSYLAGAARPLMITSAAPVRPARRRAVVVRQVRSLLLPGVCAVRVARGWWRRGGLAATSRSRSTAAVQPRQPPGLLPSLTPPQLKLLPPPQGGARQRRWLPVRLCLGRRGVWGAGLRLCPPDLQSAAGG